jgi:uncharacterized protein YjbI with pentapeptide repeats/histidyl-tRNA synthetase
MRSDFGRLPRGFLDYVGDEAERQAAVAELFRRTCVAYGFTTAAVASVGFADTFERFGHAAHDRIYDFPDRGGRRLALTADAFAPMLRAITGAGLLTGGARVAAAARVSVARYQRRPRRAWSQLAAMICNEPDELGADLTLLRLWHDVLTACGVPYRLEFCDFGMLDVLAAELGLTPQEAREALHRRRKAMPPESPRCAVLLDRLSGVDRAAAGHADPFAALDAIGRFEPVLADRVAHVREVAAVATGLGVSVTLDRTWSHGTEYHAGLCFVTRDPAGVTVVDGGGYHHLAATLDPKLTCWSSAGGLELLATAVSRRTRPRVHLLRVAPVPVHDFLSAGRSLRAAGYAVHEIWRPRALRREIRQLPVDPDVWFSVVGPREATRGSLVLQNAHDPHRRQPWRFLPATGESGPRPDAPRNEEAPMAHPSHVDLLEKLHSAEDRGPALEEISTLTRRLLAETGRGLQLSEAGLANLDLSGADLSGAVLNRAVLHGTRLRGAVLDRCTMICPGLERTDFTGASLREAYVHALAAQTCSFDDARLDGLRDATGSLFHGCSMRRAVLSGSHLAGATYYQCDLTGADLRTANLQGASINECLLRATQLDDAMVDQLVITKCDLTGASLRGAHGAGLVVQRPTAADDLDLSGARLPGLRLADVRADGLRADRLSATGADVNGCVLAAARLRAAGLHSVRLVDSALPGADLTDAVITGGSVRNCVLSDIRLTNAQAENVSVVESRLHKAQMSGFVGRCAVFRDVDLRGADLSQANLYRAMLTGDPPRGMCLSGADLSGAILVQAYLAADLTGADLRGVNAAYSRFSQSDLSGADLSGAAMFQSTWVKVECHRVRLAGVRPPLFADRCPGLIESIRESSGPEATTFTDYLASLGTVLSGGQRGST